jgi:hypothetical protein
MPSARASHLHRGKFKKGFCVWPKVGAEYGEQLELPALPPAQREIRKATGFRETLHEQFAKVATRRPSQGLPILPDERRASLAGRLATPLKRAAVHR